MDINTSAVLRDQASRLAARGMRDAALELLERVPEADGAVLRARIYCQQGRLREGVRWWKAAVAADAANEEAKRGLALAERLARSSAGRVRLHSRRIALSLVCIVVAGLGAWWVAAPRSVPNNRELATALNRLEQRLTSGNAKSHADFEALGELIGREQAAESQSQDQVRGQLQRLQLQLRRVEKAVAERAKQ